MIFIVLLIFLHSLLYFQAPVSKIVHSSAGRHPIQSSLATVYHSFVSETVSIASLCLVVTIYYGKSLVEFLVLFFVLYRFCEGSKTPQKVEDEENMIRLISDLLNPICLFHLFLAEVHSSYMNS